MTNRFSEVPGILGPLLVAMMAAHGSAAPFMLVRDGRPQAEIVLVGAESHGPAEFAATELQRYIRMMSGAVLPVRDKATGGPHVELKVDPGMPPSVQTADKLALQDRYQIEINAAGIRIRGMTGRAVLYGAYDLLERLGCGWCVPGDDTVPTRSTISVEPVRIDTAPVFRYRMMLDFPMNSTAQTIAIADWLAKNRMNWIHPCENARGDPKVWYERQAIVVPEIKKRGLNLIIGGHTMHTWCPEGHFTEHPEWFALVNGKRVAPTLCVSNPEVVDTVVRNMRRFLDRCPEVDVIDLWHPDGSVFCHCPLCTRGVLPAETEGRPAAGIPRDSFHAAYVISYLIFVNQVAAALAESHPRVMVSPLIYGSSDRALPDDAPPLRENILFGLAHIFRDSYRPLAGEPKSAKNMRFFGNDITWMSKAGHHYIYEYYNCCCKPYIYPGAQVIVRDLQLLRQVGCQGSSSDMCGYSPINMYVAARALWSPDISWEEAIRDYCRRFYGNVAEDMAGNRIALEKGIFGRAGFQAHGGLDDRDGQESYWKLISPDCGLYLREQRPRQIAFLERMLATAEDPAVKTRIKRDLTPWKSWSEEPQWWAFPKFSLPQTVPAEANE